MALAAKKRPENERSIVLNHRFEHRITVARFGKESMDAGHYANALLKYNEYFRIMADVKQVKDAYSLSPKNFDPKKDLSEMLMMSHLYFEMARIYDASPRFTDEAKKCIDQFVLFSVDQPYQVINSELARKSLRKRSFKNPKFFRDAYEQIFVKSKKCYIVTFCFGDTHPVTNQFRKLKDLFLEYQAGRELIRIYYLYSSVAVEKWKNNLFMRLFAKLIIKPILLLLSKVLLPLIIKSC
jgi:hypothetical protein